MSFKAFRSILCLVIILKLANCFIASQKTDNSREDISFENQINNILTTFERKLDTHTLTKNDEAIILFLLKLITKRRQELEEQRLQERPVYWHLRQGR